MQTYGSSHQAITNKKDGNSILNTYTMLTNTGLYTKLWWFSKLVSKMVLAGTRFPLKRVKRHQYLWKNKIVWAAQYGEEFHSIWGMFYSVSGKQTKNPAKIPHKYVAHWWKMKISEINHLFEEYGFEVARHSKLTRNSQTLILWEFWLNFIHSLCEPSERFLYKKLL